MTPPRKKPQAGEASAAKPKKARRTLGGPQLKMPLAGVIADLRERRLLPVAMLLVVAIVAVPLSLSNGREPAKAKPAAAQGTTAGLGGEQAVVLANQSGVRDYRKRLAGDPKDPFEQHFQPPASASGGGGSSTGVSQVSAATPSGPASSAAASGGSGAAAAPDTTQPSGDAYVTHAVDLYVGAVEGKPKIRRDVFGTVPLPNKKNAVAVLMGVPLSGPVKTEFLVADGVQIGGDAKCEFGGAGNCQLLSLKPGDAAKLTDAAGRVYLIKLLSINPIVQKTVPAGHSK